MVGYGGTNKRRALARVQAFMPTRKRFARFEKTQAGAATFCVDACAIAADASAASSRLLCSSNAASNGVSALGSCKVPSF